MQTQSTLLVKAEKDYSATLNAVKRLRGKNDLRLLCDSATDLMLYIADPDGHKDDVQGLALASSVLFNLLSDMSFLYQELNYEEQENNDQYPEL